MEAFPNTKVILSVRDPKKWYLSVKNTIRYGQSVYSSFPVNILMELIGKRKTVNMIGEFTFFRSNDLDLGKYFFKHSPDGTMMS